MSVRLARREVRGTATLALPMIGAQLAGMGQSVAEVVLAGHLDARVLGAVAVGSGIWSLAFLAALGLANALPPVVAMLDGAGRRREVGEAFRDALAVAAVTGALLAAAVWFGGPALVALLRLDPALGRAAIGFIHASAPGFPGLTLLLACRGLSDGLARPRPGLVVTLGGLVVLVPLTWVLMVGRLGAPPLGAAGSALSLSIVLWVECAGMAAWLRWSGRYEGLGDGRPTLAGIAVLLRLGLPITAGVLLEASLFSTSGLVIGRFGDVAAASHQVALTAAGLAFMVPLGLAGAVTVRVGNAAGRGDRVAARRAGFVGMGLALAFECASGATLLLVPHRVASLVSADPAVVASAVPLLRLAGLFQLSDGLQVVAAGALRGLQDVAVPVAITAAAYWGVGMPVALALAFGAAWQAQGMWTGLIAGLTTAALLLAARFAVVSRRVGQGGAAQAAGRP